MNKRLLFYLIAFSGFQVFSQVTMTLEDCDKALQQNNLELLSEQYNVTAAQAAVVQARIWEHPILSADWNAYNPESDIYFDIKHQKTVAIDQLIYLGGKKRNEIKRSCQQAEIASLQLEELLFNLKFQLRRSFYSLYFDTKKNTVLESQISRIENLLTAYEEQAAKGNIALKEVVRLQSLLLDLKNQRFEILEQIVEERKDLALLTGIENPIIPVVNEKLLLEQFQMQLLNVDILVEKGKEKNPEFRIALKDIEAHETAVKFQKSLAVPDVNLGVGYDQASGAFRDEVNMRLSIPLPLWNKNKGNIKIAQAELDQSKTQSELRLLELKSEMQRAFDWWEENRREASGIKPTVYENLEQVNQGVFSNFSKRNISLNEFTDFMESYNSSMLHINERYKQLILSGETLNHLTNTSIF
ncbi:TolC family protein [Flavobacterium silvaticum]|uniref:TolC family protein n=1 Tax=Flavobacterium silvaticum TaxID=1852020 RepID=A0A972JJ81_9FLAO|nr:TolC family protein [Flavobacterium silvaticum]NMH27942.1 TolC family protein [Flavobacterium silvaticum]